jgi:iron complex transport system substrate-binding protein
MRSALLRPTALTAIALAAALTLAGCGSDSGDATPSAGATTPAADDAADQFPVTIPNTFGETTIPEQPERVATIAWGNHDVAIALGVVPVGMQKATYGDDDTDGVLPWTREALDALGVTGDAMPVLFDESTSLDLEAVSNATPDVVLAAYSGLTQEEWTTLSQIAPTVSYPKYAWGTSWRDMALIDGKALGLEDEAQAVIDEVEDQIADGLASRPDIEGKSVAYGWIDATDPSKVSLYAPLDARVQLMDDLGMRSADSVIELAGDSEEFFLDVSAENADLLADVDIFVVYGDDTTLATLQADPLWSKVPAIERGSVVVMPAAGPLSAATSGPTVLSVPWALDDYLDLFQAAAEQV